MSTSDLCSALLRFRQLIANGTEPESAFLLAHDPIDNEALNERLAQTSASIARTIEQVLICNTALERTDAALADTQALLAQQRPPIA